MSCRVFALHKVPRENESGIFGVAPFCWSRNVHLRIVKRKGVILLWKARIGPVKEQNNRMWAITQLIPKQRTNAAYKLYHPSSNTVC